MGRRTISDEFIKSLPGHANDYIEECLSNTKEMATNSGKVLKIQDRHIPTINYFLMIWLPKRVEGSIVRSTWYEWLRFEQNDSFSKQKNARIKLKSDTIKSIDELFNALASDIVANEGKGIFYAKNKLGMTDKVEKKVDATVTQAEPITGMEVK